MKNKKWVVICLLIICMVVSVPIISANKIDMEYDHASFPPDFLVILGRYTSVEIEQNSTLKQSLIIQCNSGRLLVFGGYWWKAPGPYGAWLYSFDSFRRVIEIKAPCFCGFYHNNRICGITFGDYIVCRK